MPTDLPAGLLTFAFVDVVESTSLLRRHGEDFVAALARLHEVVATATVAAAGTVVQTEGDGAFLVFPDADGAVSALLDIQAQLATPSPDGQLVLALRAGANTGDAAPVAGNYVSLQVNLAARVAASAHGGQVLVTASTVDALTDASHREVAGEPIGEFALKDIPSPTPLWRLCGPADAPRAAPFRRTNVEAPMTSFVGRRGEVKSLLDDVDQHRLVTVMGPGGVGKTRLVSEFALRHAERWPGGAWLVELAAASDGDQALAAVEAALGSKGGSVQALAKAADRNGPALLILDNCEHLLDEIAELVGSLLAQSAETRVLATSREALRVTGEKVWRLGPLLSDDDRFELFNGRAGAAGATIAQPDLDVVLELCNRLDGLPLAIELAAAHSADTPLADLLEVVAGGHDPLPRRGGQARQSSLDAVVAWSVDRLSPSERDALLVLSTVPGRMTREMAITILNALSSERGVEPNGVLRALVRGSLIDLDGDQYRLLDTIRAAARRLLALDSTLAREAVEAVRAWAVDLAVTHDRRITGLDFVRDDQVLALEDVLENASGEGYAGLGPVWDLLVAVVTTRRRSDRALALAADALRKVDVIDSDTAYTVAAAVELVTGTVGDGHGQLGADDLAARLEAGERHASGPGLRRLRAVAAFEYAYMGEVARARRLLDQLLSDADENLHDHAYAIAIAHSVGSLIASAEDDANAYLEHALKALEAIISFKTDYYQRNVFETNVGDGYLLVDQPDRALEHATEALQRTAPTDMIRGHILRLMTLAYTRLGQTDDALAVGWEAERTLRERLDEVPHFANELDNLYRELPALRESERLT